MELLVFLEVVIQVRATAELKNGAKTVVVDLNSVVVLHYSAMVKLLVDLILPEGMLNVVIFHLVSPAVIKVMNFTSHLNTIV